MLDFIQIHLVRRSFDLVKLQKKPLASDLKKANNIFIKSLIWWLLPSVVVHMDIEHAMHWLCRKTGVKEALNELPQEVLVRCKLRVSGAGWRSRKARDPLRPLQRTQPIRKFWKNTQAISITFTTHTPITHSDTYLRNKVYH